MGCISEIYLNLVKCMYVDIDLDLVRRINERRKITEKRKERKEKTKERMKKTPYKSVAVLHISSSCLYASVLKAISTE